MKKLFSFYLLLFLTGFTLGQEFSVSAIPSGLKEDAYAVVRIDDLKIEYLSSSKVKMTHNLAVTVLSEAGVKYAYRPMYYDKSTRINKMEATLYNASGKKIQTLKNKDIKDVSAVDGFSMYLDDRVKSFDFNPASCPFTSQYLLEEVSSST